MKSSHPIIPYWLFTSAVLIIGVFFFSSLWDITSTTNLGENDFVGYWSATYLFHNGQNPYDPELMEITQRTQLQTDLDSTIMAWNPPSLFVLLLPLAWLSFDAAKYVWLIINLIILVTAGLMLIRIYLPANNTRTTLIYLVFVAIFPPVASGLYMGQVTFLVFLGLVASVALIKKGHWFWAGAVLVLTTIKPHLVILPLIYLLISMVQYRKYEGWAGLILAGIACLIVLFIFRANWINDFIGESAIAPVNWATPTIGGLLSYLHISNAARYLIILFLPLPFLLARYHAVVPMEFAVALLTLITIPTTFFGWSYDQTLLLIPVAQILGWMSRLKDRLFNLAVATALAMAIIFNYYQRLLSTNDVYYFWVPIFWWIIFGLSRYRSLQTVNNYD